MHGQVGISTDTDVTPNTRVPVGEEPALPEHLLFTAKTHRSILQLESESCSPLKNGEEQSHGGSGHYQKGAFKENMRYFFLLFQ